MLLIISVDCLSLIQSEISKFIPNIQWNTYLENHRESRTESYLFRLCFSNFYVWCWGLMYFGFEVHLMVLAKKIQMPCHHSWHQNKGSTAFSTVDSGYSRCFLGLGTPLVGSGLVDSVEIATTIHLYILIQWWELSFLLMHDMCQ